MNTLPLILSFLYCGIGQIYKGELLKGLVFMILYTFLILFTFFTRPWSLINSLSIPAIILMWITGMLDAYLYPGTIDDVISTLHFARPILIGIAISISIIILGVFVMLQRPEHERAGIAPEIVSSNADIDYSSPKNTDIAVWLRDNLELILILTAILWMIVVIGIAYLRGYTRH